MSSEVPTLIERLQLTEQELLRAANGNPEALEYYQAERVHNAWKHIEKLERERDNLKRQLDAIIEANAELRTALYDPRRGIQA